MPTTPPQEINSENGLLHRVAALLHNRVKRSLRVAFTANVDPDLTALSFTKGEQAKIPGGYTPDFAYFEPTITLAGDRDNRCPGELKVSFKWQSAWQNHPHPTYQREFRQVLS